MLSLSIKKSTYETWWIERYNNKQHIEPLQNLSALSTFTQCKFGTFLQNSCHIQQAHGAEQLMAAELEAKRAFDKGVIAERDANRKHSQGYLRFIKSQVPLNPYVADKDNIDISAFDFLCLISNIPLQLSKWIRSDVHLSRRLWMFAKCYTCVQYDLC